MMPFFLILMLAAYIGGNAYIFTRALQALPPMPAIFKWLFGLAYWGYALSIFLVFIFRARESADPWGHFFFQVSTGWLVFTLYMVLALVCFDCLSPASDTVSRVPCSLRQGCSPTDTTPISILSCAK